jgi:hypothetical protein
MKVVEDLVVYHVDEGDGAIDVNLPHGRFMARYPVLSAYHHVGPSYKRMGAIKTCQILIEFIKI